MPQDPAETIRRLAALRAQRALADLAAARARAAAAAEAAAAAFRQAGEETYPDAPDALALKAAWARREALSAAGAENRRVHAARLSEAAAAEAAAAEACSREIGADAMAARAAAARRGAEARRAERVSGVLAALRGPASGF